MKKEGKRKILNKKTPIVSFDEIFNEDWYEKYIENKKSIIKPGFVFWKTSIKKINEIIKEEALSKDKTETKNIEKILAFNTITHSAYLPKVFPFIWKNIELENKKIILSKIHNFLFSIENPSKKDIEVASKWSSLLYFDYIQQIKKEGMEKKSIIDEKNNTSGFIKETWNNHQELLKKMIDNSSFFDDAFFVSRLKEQTSNNLFLFQNKIDNKNYKQDKEMFENFLYNLSFLSYIVNKIKDTKEEHQVFNVMSIFSRIIPSGVINNSYGSINNTVITDFSKNEKKFKVLLDCLLMINVFDNIKSNIENKTPIFSFNNENVNSPKLDELYLDLKTLKNHINSYVGTSSSNIQIISSNIGNFIQNKNSTQSLLSSCNLKIYMKVEDPPEIYLDAEAKKTSEIRKNFLDGFFSALKLAIHVAISTVEETNFNEEQTKQTNAIIKKQTQRF